MSGEGARTVDGKATRTVNGEGAPVMSGEGTCAMSSESDRPRSGAPLRCPLPFRVRVNAAHLVRSVDQSGGGVLCATVEPTNTCGCVACFPLLPPCGWAWAFIPGGSPTDAVGRRMSPHGARLVQDAGFVAEVGLDFGKRHGMARDAQHSAFERICRAAADAGGKVLSIHSVNAASEVLDVLEQTGCVASGDGDGPCTCILHWYSGPFDQLQRAIRLGCFFSVGERMLSTPSRARVRAGRSLRSSASGDRPSRGAVQFLRFRGNRIVACPRVLRAGTNAQRGSARAHRRDEPARAAPHAVRTPYRRAVAPSPGPAPARYRHRLRFRAAPFPVEPRPAARFRAAFFPAAPRLAPPFCALPLFLAGRASDVFGFLRTL